MRYLVWNALLPVDTVTVLRGCSQCVLLAFCTFFVSYHKDFWNKYIFLPKDCMKDQYLLVLTFKLFLVSCHTASYLVSVQICEIVTVSSLCPSRNWRDVVLSTLCSALGTRVSRRICVSASTRLSSTLSQTVQSRFKKFKMNVQDWYLNILNTKLCPSLQILCLMYKIKFLRRSGWFCNSFFSLKV